MALVLADRVKETSTTSGTGTLTLAGASTGYRSFAAVGDGNTTYYSIVDNTTGDWEVGLGTYTSSGTTLSRDTVLSNSLGTTAKINFAANIKDVFVTYPAGKSVNYDASGNITDSGNLNFTGTGNRITGDFSNATIANRVMFQTSTVNENTSINVIPNGTGVGANFFAYNNSDPTNASRARIGVGSSIVSIQADITGTGTYLPMTFYTGGSERFRIGTSGQWGLSGTNYGTSGQVLKSNGASSAPTWSDPSAPSIQTQTISSGSGTWSKPTTGNYQWLKIELWGAGAGGARGGAGQNGCGGSGGAYHTITVPLSSLATSETYSIGAGGASRTTTGAGNNGGDTTFTINGKTITGYGGTGGNSGVSNGPGGAGVMGVGAITTNGGNPAGGTAVGASSTFGGGGGGAGSTNTSPVGGMSYYGGGGGGGSGGGTATGGTAGGNSFYGGAGGGGGSDSAAWSGGTSVFGGNGGAGAFNASNGVNGSTPGGGGGSAESGNSGAGGNGQIILTWW